MKTSDFDYDLPLEFIAQTPVEPRDSSRLLIMNRAKGTIEHRIFSDISEYLQAGDLLVLNQTRVIPARLYGQKLTGGKVEILLLHREENRVWECIVGGKGLKKGRKIRIDDNGPAAVIIEVLDGARRLIEFEMPIDLYLSRVGQVPLPPYIHETLNNPERYQTVYAREPGSAAAPTAGLHFTPALLEKLKSQGVQLGFVTLHVGLDTFAPVTENDPREHAIHSEWCRLTRETSDLVNKTRAEGGRIIAVGTTSVRTLESAARHAVRIKSKDPIEPYTGRTDLYIFPGFTYRVVDAMITNFHLPRSTLIMLVSAFASRERVLQAYEIAKKERYRFYSFGDAMFIL